MPATGTSRYRVGFATTWRPCWPSGAPAIRGRLGRGDYLFLRPSGLPLNLDKFRQDVIRPALRDAGLPETLRTYDIRHSHASLLIDQGANPLAVAQRMGHTDPAVTFRVYGHLFAGAQEELTERLDSLRRGSSRTSGVSDIVDLGRASRSGKP